MKNMNVSFHVSLFFLRYIYVPVVSILENNKSYYISFYILSSTINESDLSILRELVAERGRVVLIHVNLPKGNDESSYVYEYMYRNIKTIFPGNIDRILVLDCDIVVKKSLKRLYELPIEDYYCACSDGACVSGEKIDGWMQLFQKLNCDSFSSVCTLYNLKKIRDEITDESIIDSIKYVKEKVDYTNRELAAGILFNKKIFYFSEYEYGFYVNGITEKTLTDEQINYYSDNSVIIHYFRSHPWNPGVGFSKIVQYWWSYAKLTPMYEVYVEEFWDSWKKIRNDTNRARALSLSLYDDFKYIFSSKIDKRIVLYGVRTKTEVIIEQNELFNIVGVLDKDKDNIGLWINQVPIIDYKEANKNADMIVIVTVAKYWEEIFNRIKDKIDLKIEIYGLSGENLREKYK